jgi:hypothetical protein
MEIPERDVTQKEAAGAPTPTAKLNNFTPAAQTAAET